MLYPTEDFKVYGYISNTRIKFMLVVDEMLQKEDEMRMVRLDISFSETKCCSPARLPILPRIHKVVAQNERQLTVLTLICRCSKDFTQPM